MALATSCGFEGANTTIPFQIRLRRENGTAAVSSAVDDGATRRLVGSALQQSLHTDDLGRRISLEPRSE